MAGARVAALDLWMNGIRVGRWERSAAQVDRLIYDPDWVRSAEGRPLSLSLPLTGADAQALRGSAVSAYFENLIPDNDAILRRLRDRFGARSTSAFDLLAEIGRDCAGAIQLVPADANPGDIRRIDAERLDEAGVAKRIRSTTVTRLRPDESDAFRLSIAGAQEKTALLWHHGRWCVPKGATPSTHIFKLPLGLVGNVRADLHDSVELEWLSMSLIREYGLETANVEIGQFENQRVLIVERFDRRRAAGGDWWIRVPQEDFCQVLGLPPSRKYEADGGPGVSRIMDVLRGSENAAADRVDFFRTQVLYWVMAATDGHAKNFSLVQLPGGRYRRTPLYDVLSTYPVQGKGAIRLDPHDLKLAMAVEGRNRHYKLGEIHRWHWVAMGERLGLEQPAPELIEAICRRTPEAIDIVRDRLPPNFPMPVFNAVQKGMRAAVAKLLSEPDRRRFEKA